MIEFLKPELSFSRVEGDDSYGKFVMEPLARGYGVTVGNALRRILLSSMSGACVSSITIDGVLHEYCAIEGVMEDVTDIVINLKKLVLRSHSEEPVTLKLEAVGPKVVTAADITPDSRVEIIDKDAYICEITGEGTKLSMELVVKKGVGYQMAEHNLKGEYPLNTIFLDCHFTPVKKVNYTVEDARVGQDINYDRLILEVWTNGAMQPEEAIRLSAEIMKMHMQLIADFDFENKWPEERVAMISDEKEEENKAYDIPIKDLEFSVRSLNCLQQENIRTLGELAQKRASDLLAIKNFGKKSLYEIREKLAQYGLSLRDDDV